jgi:hypothetical protein
MVSLEQQNNYLSNAIRNDKLKAFYSMLQLANFEYSKENLSEVDEIYFKIINSIIKKNKQSFIDSYKDLSKRVPSDNTPFIHNDLQIFSTILAVFIFDEDRSWITMVVGKRSKSLITTTFENILNDNYQSNNNVQEIITVFLYLTKNENLTSEILESTYKSILNNPNLFENKNDFHIIISLKAFESILSLIKKFPNREEYNFLKEFEKKFKKRILYLSNFLYYLVLIVCIYYLFKIIRSNEDLKNILQDLGSILSLLGLAIGGSLFAVFKNKFQLQILKIYGYNNNNNNI